MYEVKMPQWGMNMTEGAIVQWFKQVGEHVEQGEDLVEIEAAKTISTLESPVSGTLVEIVLPVDGEVEVGGVIARIEQ